MGKKMRILKGIALVAAPLLAAAMISGSTYSPCTSPTPTPDNSPVVVHVAYNHTTFKTDINCDGIEELATMDDDNTLEVINFLMFKPNGVETRYDTDNDYYTLPGVGQVTGLVTVNGSPLVQRQVGDKSTVSLLESFLTNPDPAILDTIEMAAYNRLTRTEDGAIAWRNDAASYGIIKITPDGKLKTEMHYGIGTIADIVELHDADGNLFNSIVYATWPDPVQTTTTTTAVPTTPGNP